MEDATHPRHQGFPSWTQTPIPGVSLSAGGLLALADLSTVAQRTALTGGSTWLDALLLVPGLHYQQAADELARKAGGGSDPSPSLFRAVETDAAGGGSGREVVINNAALALFVQGVACKGGEAVDIDVGKLPSTIGSGLRRFGEQLVEFVSEGSSGVGWLSHLLYLISPVLTVAALVFMVLLQDWWGLGSLCALMLSRMLNIWVIKQRAKKKLDRPPSLAPAPPAPPSSSPPTAQPAPPTGSLRITLPGDRTIRLLGAAEDLHAVTAEAWLRAKTHAEGYLEAAAKLLVYLVAAVSGNQTQAGSIVMMGLLLLSAGLLALSNGHARGATVNGRRVRVPSGQPGNGRRKVRSDPLPSRFRHDQPAGNDGIGGW